MHLRHACLALAVSACGSGASPVAAPDASAPDASAPACTLVAAGAPVTLVALDQRHVSAPQMVVLDPGAPDAGSASTSLAVQFFANASVMGIPDDIEIARARIDRAWPGATVDRPPALVGELAFGFAQLARAPSGAVAIGWHREEIGVGKPELRAFDVASWAPGATSEIAVKGDAVLSLVPSDDGWGVVWRDLNAPGVGPVQPLFAALSASGAVSRGPIALAGPHDYPGPSPSVAWIGGKFVAFIGYDDCPFGDAACVARAVVVATIGDAAIARTSAIAAIAPSTSPGHVASAAYDDRVWLAWSEGDAKNEMAPRTVRLAAVDARGAVALAPITLAEAAPVSTSVAITASDLGVLVAWAERGDAGLSQNARGSSRIVARRVSLAGAPDPAVAIAATFVDTYGPPTSAAIAAPRGALVLWAGRAAKDGDPDVAWLARLDCAVP